jgi:hypothetical protein
MVPLVVTEKIPSVTLPGIDPETVRLVAQCLNHYATPDPIVHILGIIIDKYLCNRQIFIQQLARTEAYFLITLYFTLLYMLLWRRVKKNTPVIEGRWITMQTEMVTTWG